MEDYESQIVVARQLVPYNLRQNRPHPPALDCTDGKNDHSRCVFMSNHELFPTAPHSGPNRVFDMLGMPDMWLEKARELHRSAALLFQQIQVDLESLESELTKMDLNRPHQSNATVPGLWHVWVFLESLALEHLVKALYIRSKPLELENGKLRGDVIAKRDLTKMAENLAISLNADERSVLDYSTVTIMSWGRYPLPSDQSKLFSVRKTSICVSKVYNGLFERFVNDLEKRPFQPSTPTLPQNVEQK
jgi:hypothetical protein